MVVLAILILVWPGTEIQASTKGVSDSYLSPAGNNYQIQEGLSSIPTDQIILKYKSTSAAFIRPEVAGQLERLSSATSTIVNFLRSMSGDAIVLRLPERLPVDQVQAIANQLMTLPEVEYAEPDAIMQHTLVPNDPMYSNQWHYFAPTAGNYGINAPTAWDITTGSANIVVAVIDTGITNHVEFVGRTVPGYDFISDPLKANDGDGRDSDPSDPGDWITAAENASGYFAGCPVSDSSWHGTHTSGTIGAASNNGVGVAGINWYSKILPVRVLGKCGGYISDISDGMRWAAGLTVNGVPTNANPAKVENISLGGVGPCSTTYQNAINAITVAGTTVVTSAGNRSEDAVNFQPGNCNGVVTVAATNRNGNRAGYSNYGSTIEISAPGGDSGIGVLSTINTGTQGPVADTYAYYQGTSMAAPHVTGVISLLYSLNPTLTPSQVLTIIQNFATAFPSGSTCSTSICGNGIVNAGAAVASIVRILSVNKSGTGSGIVTSTLPGINCGYTCSAYFNTNSTVTLTATNAADSTFTGWGGSGCSGMDTCVVTMDIAKLVTADFTLNIYRIYLPLVIK
jgi:serine protease